MRSLSAFIVLFLALSVSGQTPSNFSGVWRQEANSGTQRQVEVEQKGSSLRVKASVTNSESTRNLEVKYEIGGLQTTYTGLDGDEFHTSVRRDGNTLVFDTIEHEAGSNIIQKVVWSLSADSHTLQVDRQVTKSGQTTHSSTTFVRQP